QLPRWQVEPPNPTPRVGWSGKPRLQEAGEHLVPPSALTVPLGELQVSDADHLAALVGDVDAHGLLRQDAQGVHGDGRGLRPRDRDAGCARDVVRHALWLHDLVADDAVVLGDRVAVTAPLESAGAVTGHLDVLPAQRRELSALGEGVEVPARV